MSNNPDESIPSPIEAIQRFQRELKLQIDKAEKDVASLQTDTIKNVATLQKRCAKLREILELLGDHAVKHPNEPLPPDIWEQITST